jgi:beta-N-acetylhexosaminidase
VSAKRPARRKSHGPIGTRLSAQQLAGQRIIYAYAGLKPPASLLSAIRAGEAGGVIFFAPNVSSVSQLRGVIGQHRLRQPRHEEQRGARSRVAGIVRRVRDCAGVTAEGRGVASVL